MRTILRKLSHIYTISSTNLPKELMGFPDYDFDKNIEESFIRSELVLDYLQNYSEHFKLTPYIKLEHEIIRVRPRSEGWEVGMTNELLYRIL